MIHCRLRPRDSAENLRRSRRSCCFRCFAAFAKRRSATRTASSSSPRKRSSTEDFRCSRALKSTVGCSSAGETPSTLDPRAARTSLRSTVGASGASSAVSSIASACCASKVSASSPSAVLPAGDVRRVARLSRARHSESSPSAFSAACAPRSPTGVAFWPRGSGSGSGRGGSAPRSKPFGRFTAPLARTGRAALRPPAE